MLKNDSVFSNFCNVIPQSALIEDFCMFFFSVGFLLSSYSETMFLAIFDIRGGPNLIFRRILVGYFVT